MNVPRFDVHGLSAEKAQRISGRIRISEPAVREAGDFWQATASALRAGAHASGGAVNPMELRRRYGGIRRLTAEARRMIMLSTAPETRKAVYAIDPHLIRGYSSFWESTNFGAFDFLDQEWLEGEGEERTRFIVYLLGSILRMEHLVCLEAGREEIANMLAGFLQGHEQAPDLDDQIAAFAAALKNIQQTVAFTERMNTAPEEISNYIIDKFEALVGAGGIPLMQQQMSATRLARVLKSKTLKGSFYALRAKLPEDQQEALVRAERLFKAVCRDQDFLHDARNGLYEAYASFGRLSDISDAGTRSRISSDVSQFRPNEFSNINALFEVHLLNACLSEEGVNARVRYITDSSLLFAFVSAFPPDVLEVELVHPRHVFIFENRLTDGNLDRFQQVVTAPDAFADAVPADGEIRVGELDTFEKNYAPMLRVVRSTYSFAAVDFRSARDAMAEVMRRFISTHGGERAEELNRNLSDIASHIAATSESVRTAFGATAPELSEMGFDAYKEFVENLAGDNRGTLMLVRRFGAEGGGDGAVPRLVCVPVGGGYRQIFKIYQPDVVRRLGEYDAEVGTMDMPTIITSIKDILADVPIADGSGPERQVAAALPDYTRALYAMIGREWLLAQTYCKSSLRKLCILEDRCSPDSEVVSGDSSAGRRRLMIQEVLIVQHFARRGIGTNLESIGRRRRWLNLAAEDLHDAGALIASVSDRGSYATEYEPNSVRLALAAFGMLVEWLALKSTRQSKGRSLQIESGESVLPVIDQPNLAWFGLDTLTRPLADHWADEMAATRIRDDLDELNRRIARILSEVEGGAGIVGHSYEFWRFIAIRGLGIRTLLDLMGRLSLIDLNVDTQAGRIDARATALLAEHEDYIHECRRAFGDTGSGETTPPHPFNDLIGAAHLLLDLPDGASGASLTTRLRRGEILLLISRLQHGLSATGFPRSISKALLARYGGEAAVQLREVAASLERAASLAGGR